MEREWEEGGGGKGGCGGIGSRRSGNSEGGGEEVAEVGERRGLTV